MKLRRMGGAPHRGMGPGGSPKRMSGLMAGEHLPQRTNSGYSDRSGYDASAARRNGKQTGSIPAPAKHSGGNSKGSAPPGVSKPKVSVAKQRGRGGQGTLDQRDSNRLSESPNSAWFEKLGAS